MANKAIRSTFAAELAAAGVLNLPFSWTPDGEITYGTEITAEQKAAIEAVYAAHDPAKGQAEDLKAAFAASIQLWLDQTARGLGYNDLLAAVSYQNSADDLWKRQGDAFAAWRDAVWHAAFALLADVQAGIKPMPETPNDVIAALPPPNIPTM